MAGGAEVAVVLERMVDPTVVVVVFELALSEELEFEVPKEEVEGNGAAAELIFAADRDEIIAAAAPEVEVALVDELTIATVEFDCDALGPATLLAVLGRVDCLLELPCVSDRDFLDANLRDSLPSSKRASRVLRTDSDRCNAISTGWAAKGMAAALRRAEARRTKEVA